MNSLTRRGRAIVLGCLFASLVAACGGGGGGTKAPAVRAIRGKHFVFAAPGDWQVTRTPRGISVAPAKQGDDLVSVSTYPTVKPYRPSLFTRAIPEIDRAAAQYAKELGGSVASSATVTVAGGRARQYVVDYGKLRERISFVFRGKTEYFLVCQWRSSSKEPDACAQLTASFRPI